MGVFLPSVSKYPTLSPCDKSQIILNPFRYEILSFDAASF